MDKHIYEQLAADMVVCHDQNDASKTRPINSTPTFSTTSRALSMTPQMQRDPLPIAIPPPSYENTPLLRDAHIHSRSTNWPPKYIVHPPNIIPYVYCASVFSKQTRLTESVNNFAARKPPTYTQSTNPCFGVKKQNCYYISSMNRGT